MPLRPRLQCFLLSLALVCAYTHGLASTLLAQPEPHIVRSYALDVSFFPAESRLEAEADISFNPLPDSLSALVFYLHGELRVDSIGTDGAALPFSQQKVFYPFDYSMVATRVTVELPDAFEGRLFVAYRGFFHPSQARSASDYMRIDADGVYLRSYGYSLWFPVFLEAGAADPQVSFSQVTLRTPRAYTAVFVGERLSESVSGETRISQWRAPDLPLFAAQCTAHRFSVHQEDNYFIYAWPDEPSRRMAPQVADFSRQFNTLLRTHYRSDAKTDQVHIVQMPRFGDISSANLVGMAVDTWHGFEQEAFAKQTLAHEFVHPFVSVPVPPEAPLYAFVIEGFPSYFHWPLLAELMGEPYYDQKMDRVQQQYLERKRTGKGWRGSPLPPEKPLTALTDDEIGLYKDVFLLNDRAVLFFDYLRRKMGKDKFLDFANTLVNRDHLDQASFQQAILAYLPGSAEALRLWLNTTAYPDHLRRP